MTFVSVRLIDRLFTDDQKHRVAAAVTDVMVQFEGSARRESIDGMPTTRSEVSDAARVVVP